MPSGCQLTLINLLGIANGSFSSFVEVFFSILNDYLRTRNHFSAVYLLSGLDPNGNVVVKMVPQSKLDEVAKEFQKPPMKIIYSIHRNFDIVRLLHYESIAYHKKSSELIRSNVEQVLPLEKLKRYFVKSVWFQCISISKVNYDTLGASSYPERPFTE